MADVPDAVLSTREAKAHLADFLKEARTHGREVDEVVIVQTLLERADDPVVRLLQRVRQP